jgi:hypothetical protein
MMGEVDVVGGCWMLEDDGCWRILDFGGCLIWRLLDLGIA